MSAYNAQEVKQMLSDRAEEIARMLLPNGKKHGSEWVAGSISGETGKSLKVCISGSKAGIWCDFAEEDQYKGSLLDLWERVRGVSFAGALREAKQYLNISDGMPLVSPAEVKFSRPKEEKKGAVVNEYLDYFTRRGIEKTTVEGFCIRVSQGKELLFPYYKNGTLVNVKRLIPKKANDPNGFWANVRKEETKNQWEQSKGAEPCLFGWHLVNEYTSGIIICEGECDCMSLYQINGIQHKALSVPSGSSNLKWIDNDFDLLLGFDDIVLMFDQDEAGQKNLHEIVQRLGVERVRIATLPLKDVNEMLCANRSEEVIKAVNEAKYITPEELKPASHYTDAVKQIFSGNSPLMNGVSLPFTNELAQKMRFGESQITVWQGINGHGKSQFLGYAMLGFITQGKRVCIFSGEMEPEVTLYRMAVQVLGSNNPTEQWIERAMNWLDGDVWTFNKLDRTKWQRMLEVFKYAAKRYRVTHFVIDSLSCCGVSEESLDKQSDFIDALNKFKFEHKAHIHLVAHPRKSESEDKVPNKFDVRGSGAITNLVDNVISVFRNKKNEQLKQDQEMLSAKTEAEQEKIMSLPDVQLFILKNRHNGWEGKINLWYNRFNFQYYDTPSRVSRPKLWIEN